MTRGGRWGGECLRQQCQAVGSGSEPTGFLSNLYDLHDSPARYTRVVCFAHVKLTRPPAALEASCRITGPERDRVTPS
jgi:hypothetical protein